MQSAVWMFDCELASVEQHPIYVGIGCNTGAFAGGNIGGLDRMEYTIIGDNVNLAQRIECLASRWQVFVAAQTYDPASHVCAAIRLPQTNVKGKSQSVQVVSVRGVLANNDEMLLAIPVIVEFENDKNQVNGMLVRIQLHEKAIFLCLDANAACRIGQHCRCSFDCPEIAKTYSFEAEIAEIVQSQPGSLHCKTTVLRDVVGSEAIDFMKPGSLVESGMSWDDMARH
jgi:hypothetical protein